MFRIGVTGGIGSGKSTVCQAFEQHNIATVDTDFIAHGLTAPGGSAMDDIRVAFGTGFLNADGSLNRSAMRELVFKDNGAKLRLESILHPLIRSKTDLAVAAFEERGDPYVLLAIPLLVESLHRNPVDRPQANRVDRVLVVDCLETEQLTRVQVRSQLTEPQVQAIMKAQVPRSLRLRYAQDVIANFNQQPDLSDQVARLHALYLQLQR
jgi:dephospho-CoA kinase